MTVALLKALVNALIVGGVLALVKKVRKEEDDGLCKGALALVNEVRDAKPVNTLLKLVQVAHLNLFHFKTTL